MEDYEWNSSIGYLLIFLICCASVLCLCVTVVIVKNWIDNRREERNRGQYVVQYTPQYDIDVL